MVVQAIDDSADLHPCVAAVAQRGQRVGGLARLRDEEGGIFFDNGISR